jgi:hypothetical protein
MKRSDAFPSAFLKAADVNGGDVAVTIDYLDWETVGMDKTEKPVLHFRGGKTKPLILNGTNWDSIVNVTGKDDSDDWDGAKITLYSCEVQFGREMVNAIRVRTKASTPSKKDKPAKPVPADDDVPL